MSDFGKGSPEPCAMELAVVGCSAQPRNGQFPVSVTDFCQADPPLPFTCTRSKAAVILLATRPLKREQALFSSTKRLQLHELLFSFHTCVLFHRLGPHLDKSAITSFEIQYPASDESKKRLQGQPRPPTPSPFSWFCHLYSSASTTLTAVVYC